MRRPLLACALLAAICLTAFHRAEPVRGCATAKRKDDPPVAIATESALIVWDAKNKKQHFIRRASFATRAPYFGFLVPTPTRPDLGDVPDRLFADLEEWTKPKTVKNYRFEEPPSIACGGDEKVGKDDRPPVEVIEQGQVAGLDYSVLKASDPTDLGNWLAKHGYDWTRSQEAWIAPYVKAGWFVTAFQNRKSDEDDPVLSMKAVRMSFTTDRPFFPYREPVEERPNKDRKGKFDKGERSQRLLRVFVVADERMQGKLDGPNAWTGQAEWANPLTVAQRQTMAGHLEGTEAALPEGAWLTVLDDRAESRPNADLYFSPSDDQSPLQRPTRVEVVEISLIGTALCGSGLVVCGPGLLLLWILLRRGRRRDAPRRADDLKRILDQEWKG